MLQIFPMVLFLLIIHETNPVYDCFFNQNILFSPMWHCAPFSVSLLMSQERMAALHNRSAILGSELFHFSIVRKNFKENLIKFGLLGN